MHMQGSVVITRGLKMLLVLMGLLVLIFIWMYLSVDRFGKSVHPVKSDAIIVLGAQVWGNEPSPALRERCDWAFDLYQQGFAPRLILSGAHGAGNISEAEAMKRYLMRKGVPESALLLEEQSDSTRANLVFSKQIMEREGLRTAILVTHRFHQKRAQLLASELGIEASGYGAGSKALFEPFWTAREVAAISKERVLFLIRQFQ